MRKLGRFYEVHVATPLAECERRDPKGLYRQARLGEVRNLPGIDAPYEAPEQPELRIDTRLLSVEQEAQQILQLAVRDGLLEARQAEVEA